MSTIVNVDAYKQIEQWDFVEIRLYCLYNRHYLQHLPHPFTNFIFDKLHPAGSFVFLQNTGISLLQLFEFLRKLQNNVALYFVKVQKVQNRLTEHFVDVQNSQNELAGHFVNI